MSAVMQFGPGAVEDPFVKVKQLITDFVNRMQSEAADTKSGAGADEDPFVQVKGLITDLITDNSCSRRVHERPTTRLTSEKKADPENRLATYAFELEAAVSTCNVSDGESAELPVDLCTSSPQQLNTDARCNGDLKILLSSPREHRRHGR